MNLNELTIAQAAEGLRAKEFSVTELVSDCIDAIEKRNPELHAYLEIARDAMQEAGKVQEMLHGHEGISPPLLGIPFAIKDNILIEGKRCTAGSKMLERYTASYDAAVIQKLKAHGAIFLGKTNMDEFAMGSSTEYSAFGPTKNPYDISRVPGGSSGGSAAAVAGHLCVAALGSDTGGSIRQPASFTGIVGFKPTYGRVSRHGLIAMASSLDEIGPITKTVEDARLVFKAIQGPDAFDATTIQHPAPRTPHPASDLGSIKIGIPKEYFGAGLDSDVEEVIRGALKKCEDAGAHVEEVSLPHAEYALPAYYIVVPSEVSANLARYDGIRYGAHVASSLQSPVSTLYDAYAKSRAEGFGQEVKRRIMLGTYALSAGYYDAYYVKAQKIRTLVKQDFDHAFGRVDVIAGPTTPTPAFRLGERARDPLEMYRADMYTVAANLAGVPAISIPAGNVVRDGKALPAGLQLIGPRMADEKLLEIALLIEHGIR